MPYLDRGERAGGRDREDGRGVRIEVAAFDPPHDPPSVRRIPGNVKRFRGGLVFKAHRLVYHSTGSKSLASIHRTIRRASGAYLQDSYLRLIDLCIYLRLIDVCMGGRALFKAHRLVYWRTGAGSGSKSLPSIHRTIRRASGAYLQRETYLLTTYWCESI